MPKPLLPPLGAHVSVAGGMVTAIERATALGCTAAQVFVKNASQWRGRELLPALGQFVALALVIANFAFDLDRVSGPRIGPGILWLVLVFAGLVAFGRTFAAERDLIAYFGEG